MKNSIVQRVIGSLLTAFTLAFSSSAMAYTADTSVLNGPLTGLWNNSAEPGWGTSIAHQYGMIFATMYVYDNAGNATWYVASACPVTGSGCSGPLYAVTGGTNPILAWGSPNTKTTQVGYFSLDFSDVNTGTMAYSINGSNAQKRIARAMFAPAPTSTAGMITAKQVSQCPYTDSSTNAEFFACFSGTITGRLYNSSSPCTLTIAGNSVKLVTQNATVTDIINSGATYSKTSGTPNPDGSITFQVQAWSVDNGSGKGSFTLEGGTLASYYISVAVTDSTLPATASNRSLQCGFNLP